MAEQLPASQEETCCTELANSKSSVNLGYSLFIHCKSRGFAKTILQKCPTAFPHLVSIHVIRVSPPTLPPSSGAIYVNMLRCVKFIIRQSFQNVPVCHKPFGLVLAILGRNNTINTYLTQLNNNTV